MSVRISKLSSLLLGAAFLTMSFGQLIAGEINWSTDIEGSLRTATATGKPVLLEFTASWCVYCKRMEKTTFTDDAVAEYVNQRFIAVRVDADENKQLVSDLGIKGLPAILIVSPQLQVMERIPGFQTPEALMTKLARVPGKQTAALVSAANAQPRQQPNPVQQPARKELEFEPVEMRRPPEDLSSATTVRPISRPATPAPSFDDPQEENPFEFEPPAERSPRSASPRSASPRPAAAEDAAPAQDKVPVPGNASFGKAAPGSAPAGAARKSTQPSVAAKPEAEPAEDEEFFASLSKDTARPEIRVPKTRTPASKAAAFEGTCIVSAVENREISLGSPRHQLNYRGQLLFFASEENKQKFLDQPASYWPMLNGICAITLLNDEQEVQGQLEYAAFYRKRLWVFSSEEHMNQFLDDPTEVIEEVEEMLESNDE